jgi:DNA-binding Xre family transcriptional regulator
MADRKITNRELSGMIGKHENTISALKQCDEMPKVDGPLLCKLCTSLKCELWDLIEWIPDNDVAA